MAILAKIKRAEDSDEQSTPASQSPVESTTSRTRTLSDSSSVESENEPTEQRQYCVPKNLSEKTC